MASSYPGALDSFTNPSSTDAMDASAALYHDVQHANVNDAMEAVQAELGTDPAGAFTTVGQRFTQDLGAVYSSNRAWISGPTWTTGPAAFTSTLALTSQRAYYTRWVAPASMNVTNLWWIQSSSASSVTTGLVALYAANGTKLQEASTNAVITSTGIKSVAITSQAVTAGTAYYLAMLVNASGAGTVFTLATGLNISQYAGSGNADRAACYFGSQTALPATVYLDNADSFAVPPFFMGVS